MLATLILATWLNIVPVPGEDGVYNIVSDGMATQSPISPMTRTADAMIVGSPVQTRNTYSFDDLDQSYPIREVVPRSQRERVPIEERMFMQEYDLQNKQRELSIRGQELNQKIASKNFDYDQRIIGQAEQALERLGEFDPAQPDFANRWAEFKAQNPLAFQNPAFRESAGRLDTSYQQIQRDKNNMRSGISSQGTAGLSAYDNALADGKSPFEAQAVAKDAEDREQAVLRQREGMQRQRAELAARGGVNAVGAYDDAIRQQESAIEDIRKARAVIERYSPERLADFDRENPIPEVDPVIAIGKSSEAANQAKPMTRSDYTALVSFNNKLLENTTYGELSPEQQQTYDFNQQQINRYIQSQGGEPIKKEENTSALQRFNSLIGQ